jgi:hypothetical protein
MYDEIKNEPAVNAGGGVSYSYRLFAKQYHVLISKYSRGDDISTLIVEFSKVLDAWEMAKKCLHSLLPEKDWPQYAGLDFDNYPVFLWLLSFAVNLNVESATLVRTIKLINNTGRDALLDRILMKLDATHSASDKLFYPRPYQPLFDSLDAPKEKQAALVAKFLKGWYQGCKKAYWYDNAKREDSGYFGFWCFEAALIIKLWEIDDCSFCDHPNYPKDLAHWKELE